MPISSYQTGEGLESETRSHHRHATHTWQLPFLSSVSAVICLPTGSPSPPVLLQPEGASAAQPALMLSLI